MQEKQCKIAAEHKGVGKVTYEERDEILTLFERKNGLLELIKSLAAEDDETLKNQHFYEKVVADLGRITTKYQQWWDDKGQEYQWENISGYNWSIDFETCQIYLVRRLD